MGDISNEQQKTEEIRAAVFGAVAAHQRAAKPGDEVQLRPYIRAVLADARRLLKNKYSNADIYEVWLLVVLTGVSKEKGIARARPGEAGSA